MTSGIYEIVNLVTGKRYIGSAVDIKKRWNMHKFQLRNNKHHCKYLQRSWNKYGKSCFSFDVLYKCHKSECVFYEQIWIDFEGYENLYNENPKAGSSLGYKHSDEAKRKNQIAKKGYSVIQIDMRGNIIGRYESINEATRKTGISSGHIFYSVNRYVKCRDTMFVKSEENIEFALQKNKEICEAQKVATAINGKKSSKPVYQIDKQTNQIIKKWDSARDVERELKINCGHISTCALGKSKSAGGYIWYYVDDLTYEIGDIYNEKICLYQSAV